MLRVEMLPGGNGDALWIELGDEAAPRRILVDGGTDGTWEAGLRERVAALPPGDRHFELVVVTHVDADHIDGVLGLLREHELGISCGDVWFNGWRHLPDTPLESLGPVEGEQLTDLILADAMPWNAAFEGRAVGVPNEGAQQPNASLVQSRSVPAAVVASWSGMKRTLRANTLLTSSYTQWPAVRMIDRSVAPSVTAVPEQT